MEVEVFEADVVWQKVLWRSLVHGNIKAFQSFGVRVVFSGFKQPYAWVEFRQRAFRSILD